jgi:hypothetical protein
MTQFGGMGGLTVGRGLNEEDAFEMEVNRALGAKIRGSQRFACAMWCALANIVWHHDNGDTAAYSFRAAGDMITAVRRDGGNYMDWYCCGPDGVVTDEITEAMKVEGWTWKTYDDEGKP